MRRTLIVFLLIAAPALSVAQTAWNEEHSCSRAKLAGAHHWAPPGGVPLSGQRDETSGDTDVLHYDLELEIELTTGHMNGSNVIRTRALVDNLTVFRIMLRNSFIVDALRIGDADLTAIRIGATVLEVTLDRPYNTGEIFELYVSYHGTPVPAGDWGSIVFRERAGAREVWTLSSPWYSYTWWPCKEELADKATADLSFIVDEDLAVASNGLLLGIEDAGPGKLRHHWRTEYPTETYLFSLAITNYNVYDDVWEYDGGSMPLKYFLYPEQDTQEAHDHLALIPDMLDVFSELYGMYPFVDEKYGIAQCGFGGGMEHQTMTSQGWMVSDWLNAHELAHSWWGDNVTCATWHDIWLNEGPTTYSEALWFENRPQEPNGEEILHLYMDYLRPTSTTDPLYCYDASEQGRVYSRNITYLKGAWVTHMLRHVVGDEPFFDILATYREIYGGGFATTEDFIAVTEAVTGRDLRWFFDQWVYNGRRPTHWHAWRPLTIDGTQYIELMAKQTWFVFQMPIDILVSAGGQDTTYTIWHNERQEHLLLPIGDEPADALVYNAGPWVLADDGGETTFVEGPPKIATTHPNPDQTVAAQEAAGIEVVFHKDVIVDAGQFTLVGQAAGTVECSFSYDDTRHAATLVPITPLAPDTYTLTIADTIVDVAAELELDGEMVHPENTAVPGAPALPSGDGLPGGVAELTFAVSVPGDLNCDGLLDADDIDPFVLALSGPDAYNAGFPGCSRMLGDIDGNGQVDFDDIDPFVAALGAAGQ